MKRFVRQCLILAGIAVLWSSAVVANAFDWPQWRGPDRSDTSRETGLLKEWPEGGPKRVWLYKDAGSGYSGSSIVKGKYFTMGTRDQDEILIALDANTGREVWTAKIGSVLNNPYGNGPRGTPTVDGDRVFALGGQGRLICANVADGKTLWQLSMQELGGKTPGWGYAESPLVDGSQLVCTPGGLHGAIAALDKMTGKLIWQSKEFTDGAQYESIVVGEPSGVKEYIQMTAANVVGIDAKDGKLLWKIPFPGRVAVVPTPIYHDGFVYVTAGYGAGCKLVKIEPGNQASEVYANKVMENHHGGVILVGDYLYGYSDTQRGRWLCQNFKTGQEVWSERGKLGKGAIACAEGMLYCLEEKSGTVVLVEAAPTGWHEHGRLTLEPQTTLRSPQGRIWTHPVICNGKLYLRDQELIFCFDIKGG